MKKVLSGVLALMLAGTLTLPAFAAAGDITATEVTTTVGTEPEATVAPEALKGNIADEEGMLRISQSTLLKIKLQLEDANAEGKNMIFMANQNLANDEAISAEKIQFIDEKTISSDGTVTIQFRPRANQPVGIYNMRANTEGATVFGKFYKTVADQIQPSLSETGDTEKKQDISITVSGYTEAWKNATKLYEIKDNTENEIPVSDYSFEASESTPQIATLKIKTTGDWASHGLHTFRFVSTDVAYNPITFTANITKVTSSITSKFVRENMPEITGDITLPSSAVEGDTVEFAVTAPKGYDVASVDCLDEGAENVAVTKAEDTYSFTMPDSAVNVTVTVEPIEYTINFDLNGGEGSNTPITGSVETLPTLPANPIKDGYTFVGWFVSIEGGRRPVSQDIINDSFSTMLDLFDAEHTLTLTANYTENGKYEVIYQAPNAENKPTGGNYDAVKNPIITIAEQEPQREGYNFIGWKIEGDETNTIYKYDGENKTYTVSKDTAVVKFIAQWEEIPTADYEIVSVDATTGKVNVIKRTDNTNSAYIIVATYSTNGNLVKASIKDISDVQTTAAGTDVNITGAFDGDYTTVKVFMWNNLSNMHPRCAAWPKSE